MPEYLNREAVLDLITRRYENPEICTQEINSIPAADVAPVVHGRWRYFHKQNIAVCTECSFERDLDTNFGRAVNCPNCGAKMDGGKNDEHQN